MKIWQLFTTVMLSLVCLGLSISLVLVGRSAAALQQLAAGQQNRINNSVLGPRGQQISQAILQDMGNAATQNENMRELLTLHGYRLQMDQEAATSETPSAEATAADSEGDTDNE